VEPKDKEGREKMKIKRLVLTSIISLLAISMMGCPSKRNRPPKFVQITDEEVVDINRVTYYHPQGTDFSPETMLNDLVENQNIHAIDYDQDEVIWGKDRNYTDLTDDIIVVSFLQIWDDGDDANFDGVVDEQDEELYGDLKTDEEGNYVVNPQITFLLKVLPVDGEFNFSMVVYDSEGAKTEISGTIIIVEQT
jgi:hypothetical protein